MPIKNDREYRFLGQLELRAEGERVTVVGYASTFEPYLLYEDRESGYQWYEQIMPDAFAETDMSDVVFLKDHTGTVLARTKNGALKLETDAHGLLTKTDLTRTAAAREMLEEIKVGNYTQMSFSFVVANAGDRFVEEGLRITRYIDKIQKLYDVSAVAFPANPGTDIGVSYRDLFNGVIEAREAERLKAIRSRELLKLKLRIAKERNK